MSKRNRLYVAYGSNLNLEQMSHRCPTAEVVGMAVLKGYRLLFRGAHEGAVANVEPHEGGSVPVVVWRLKDADERALDRYEGFPYLYRKETVTVEMEDGGTRRAMIYIMNEGKPLGFPSPYYYGVILDGYADAGFDDTVLKQAVKDSAN